MVGRDFNFPNAPTAQPRSSPRRDPEAPQRSWTTGEQLGKQGNMRILDQAARILALMRQGQSEEEAWRSVGEEGAGISSVDPPSCAKPISTSPPNFNQYPQQRCDPRLPSVQNSLLSHPETNRILHYQPPLPSYVEPQWNYTQPRAGFSSGYAAPQMGHQPHGNYATTYPSDPRNFSFPVNHTQREFSGYTVPAPPTMAPMYSYAANPSFPAPVDYSAGFLSSAYTTNTGNGGALVYPNADPLAGYAASHPMGRAPPDGAPPISPVDNVRARATPVACSPSGLVHDSTKVLPQTPGKVLKRKKTKGPRKQRPCMTEQERSEKYIKRCVQHGVGPQWYKAIADDLGIDAGIQPPPVTPSSTNTARQQPEKHQR